MLEKWVYKQIQYKYSPNYEKRAYKLGNNCIKSDMHKKKLHLVA